MKTKLISLILVVVIATIAALSWQSGEVMAVEIPASGAGEQVNFGTSVSTVSHKLIIYWADIDGSAAENFYITQRLASNDGWAASIGGTSRRIFFRQQTDAQQGFWYPATLFSLTGYHCVAVEYDNSSTANNPSFWYDGAVNGSITEVTAPTGNIVNTGDQDLIVGAAAGITQAGLTKIPQVLIYDVSTWSAAEITQVVTDAYNSRLAIPTYRDLVFAPALYGITGANDGDTMGATDYIYDHISGAQGTPAGSPVFRADDLLTIGD